MNIYIIYIYIYVDHFLNTRGNINNDNDEWRC